MKDEPYVKAELLRLFFRAPYPLIASAVNAQLTVVVLWDDLDRYWLLAWGVAMTGWTAVRLVIWLSVFRKSTEEARLLRNGRLAVGMIAVAGALWGLLGFAVHLTPDPNSRMFIVFVAAGMAAGATGTYSTYLPAYIAYLATAAPPLALAFLLEGTATSLAVAAMIVVYCVTLTLCGVAYNRRLAETIRLQRRNVELAASLAEARDKAEAANRAKSEFLANTSHELRTPLNAVLGFSEALIRGFQGPLAPAQAEYVGIIHQSGTHLLRIINDFLDLAKVEAGRLELDEEEADPRDLVEGCAALMTERAKAGGLRLTIAVEPDLPKLRADPTRLKQVLLNLVSNAIKFTKPDGLVSLAVRRAAEGGVAFVVVDNGPGMTPAEVAIALQPFGQLDSGPAQRRQGTGLGLPLSRRLMELHGGSLHIESVKGNGTTVTVTLPAARVAGAKPARQAPTEAAAGSTR